MDIESLLYQKELLVNIVVYLDGLKDIKALEISSKTLIGLFRNDMIWRMIYENFYGNVNNYEYIDDNCRRKIIRPYGKECIGWTVKILQEDVAEENLLGGFPTQHIPSIYWKQGVIVDYRPRTFDEYLIEYVDGSTVWEKEHRQLIAEQHLAGLSRFDFLRHTKQQIHTSSSSKSTPSIPTDSAPAVSTFTNWREECLKLYCYLPSGPCVYDIRMHEDEVLALQFSHSGKYLFSCSRDGTMGIVEFEYIHGNLRMVQQCRRKNLSSLHACKVNWSPNDSYICLIMEEYPSGTPHGVAEILYFDRHRNALSRICYHSIFPFDFFGPFVGDTNLLLSRQVIEAASTSRLIQHLNLFNVDTLTPNEEMDTHNIYLSCSLSNYARGVEVFHKNVTDTIHTHLLFMCGFNPHICHMIYMFEIENKKSNSQQIDIYDLPQKDMKGAVLSITTNKSAKIHKFMFVNVRPFVDDKYLSYESVTLATALLMDVPDVLNEVELRVLNADLEDVYVFKGHHGFSLKNFLFFLYVDTLSFSKTAKATTTSATNTISPTNNNNSQNHLQQQDQQEEEQEDMCDFIASGSEDNNIYIWSLSQQRLVKVLRGHENITSDVSFNQKIPGVQASAADDFTIKIWASEGIKVSPYSGNNGADAIHEYEEDPLAL